MEKKFFGVAIKDTPIALPIVNNTNPADVMEMFANGAIRDGEWRKDKEYAKWCIAELRKWRQIMKESKNERG